LDNKEFIDQASQHSFNGVKGNFFRDTGMKSSKENPAIISILENGPASATVSIKGSVAGYPFTQILTVNQGQARIDCSLKIDWTGNPGIGNGYRQKERWQAQERQKAFYDDRDKLLLLFPLNLKSPKIYKDAPFDVTTSKLQNTYFDRWDSIKNNILLNWVDLTAGDNSYGMTVFSDHTTSYVFGKDHPLSLTVQYSGLGLWGRNYTITAPTEIRYSLFPHKGKWDKAGVMQELEKWSSPVLSEPVNKPSANEWSTQLISFDKKGWQLSAATVENDQLILRIFNASGDAVPGSLSVNAPVEKAEMIDLNGNKIQDLILKSKESGMTVSLGMPQFGFRTLRFTLKEN
jgi:alpha-mannosidase